MPSRSAANQQELDCRCVAGHHTCVLPNPEEELILALARAEAAEHDRGSCGLCGNLGFLDENGERFHCDCRADDWVEGDNGAIRCERCGGYAGEPGTSIHLAEVTDGS